MNRHCQFSVPFRAATVAVGVLLGSGISTAWAEETAPPAAEAAVAAAPASDATPEADAPEEKPGREWVRGRLETGFDTAWDDTGSDFELYQILRMSIDPPSTPKVRLQGAVWLTEDLDGDEARYSSLYGIDDGYGGDVRGRVLDLHLQIKDVLGGGVLRIGRQRILDGPLYNRIDGLRIRWDKPKWDAYFYAGSRASLYENPFDDLVIGSGAGYRIGDNTRVGIDLFHAVDDRRRSDAVSRGWLTELLHRDYPRRVETRVEDQSLGLSLYHRFNQHHWFNAQLMLQDDGAHEYTMDFSGYIERWELTYLANYARQFDRVNDRVSDLSGYYRILGGLEQYHHVHLGVQRPLTKRLAIGLETDLHDADQDDSLNTNRDYVRMAAVLSAKDLGKGVGFNLSLDRWNTSGRDGSWMLTGELSREWKAFEWAIGADYEQYRYEYVDYNPWPGFLKNVAVFALPGLYPGFSPLVALTDTREILAREEIHSIYSRFEWKIDERQRLTAKVTYEEDDGPYAPYWRIRAAYEIEF